MFGVGFVAVVVEVKRTAADLTLVSSLPLLLLYLYRHVDDDCHRSVDVSLDVATQLPCKFLGERQTDDGRCHCNINHCLLHDVFPFCHNLSFSVIIESQDVNVPLLSDVASLDDTTTIPMMMMMMMMMMVMMTMMMMMSL